MALTRVLGRSSSILRLRPLCMILSISGLRWVLYMAQSQGQNFFSTGKKNSKVVKWPENNITPVPFCWAVVKFELPSTWTSWWIICSEPNQPILISAVAAPTDSKCRFNNDSCSGLDSPGKQSSRFRLATRRLFGRMVYMSLPIRFPRASWVL